MAESITYLPDGRYRATVFKVIEGKGTLFTLLNGLPVFCREFGANASYEYFLYIHGDLVDIMDIVDGYNAKMPDYKYKLFLTPEDVCEELL